MFDTLFKNTGRQPASEETSSLEEQLDRQNIPHHVAIIMMATAAGRNGRGNPVRTVIMPVPIHSSASSLLPVNWESRS